MSPRKLLRKINAQMTSSLMIGKAILFMHDNNMFITFKFTCGYVNTDQKYMKFIHSNDNGDIMADPTYIDNLIARIFELHHQLITDPETNLKILQYMLKQTKNHCDDMYNCPFTSEISTSLQSLIEKVS